ncbi:MAG: XdhC family protein [Gammaproteobacteria bacterium]
MNPGLSGLLDAYQAQREQNRPFVLATIMAAQGSTYRKPGARMLIDADGRCFGLLGGGCFEGDLVERARDVLADGLTRVVAYDMRGADDNLWGLGLGCNGAVRVLLQRLAADNDFAPLAALADAASRRRPCVVSTVVDCERCADLLGATIVVREENGDIPDFDRYLPVAGPPHSKSGMSPFSPFFNEGSPALPDDIQRRARTVLRERRSRLLMHGSGQSTITVFHHFVPPPPHILVLGAGVDAEPVVRFAKGLGWRVTVADHRPAKAENFPDADTFVAATPESLDGTINTGDFAAAVVMSHKLERDRLYLMALARSEIPYIGLLGPAARRRSLLDSLGEDAGRIEARTYGPVGLDIGAETPEEIALSIVAGIQAVIGGREGGFLSQPRDEMLARAGIG